MWQDKVGSLQIWLRDRWRCSRCGMPLIFPPTLKLLDLMAPGRGYWTDEYPFWGAPLAALLAADVDQTTGRAVDPPCAGSVGEARSAPVTVLPWGGGSGWDGLLAVFLTLYEPEVHGRKSAYLSSWAEVLHRLRDHPDIHSRTAGRNRPAGGVFPIRTGV